MYDPNNKNDDMVERAEEAERMREHVVKEMDKNGDRMISEQEFLDQVSSRTKIKIEYQLFKCSKPNLGSCPCLKPNRVLNPRLSKKPKEWTRTATG